MTFKMTKAWEWKCRWYLSDVYATGRKKTWLGDRVKCWNTKKSEGAAWQNDVLIDWLIANALAGRKYVHWMAAEERFPTNSILTPEAVNLPLFRRRRPALFSRIVSWPSQVRQPPGYSLIPSFVRRRPKKLSTRWFQYYSRLWGRKIIVCCLLT